MKQVLVLSIAALAALSGLPAPSPVVAAPVERRAVVEGVVRDADGAPVADALVTWWHAGYDAGPASSSMTSITDESGRFEQLVSGGSWVVSAENLADADRLQSWYGGTSKATAAIVRSSSLPSSMAITIPHHLGLRGQVVGPSGLPVSGALVSAHRYSYGEFDAIETRVTGVDGSYDLSALRPGDYLVRVVPPEGSGLAPGFWSDRQAVAVGTAATAGVTAVRPDDVPAVRDVVLGEGVVLEGVVRRPDGTPVSGASVGYLPIDADIPSDGSTLPMSYARSSPRSMAPIASPRRRRVLTD